MSTLLKELIGIHEHIEKGKFVLQLTEWVTDPQTTVAVDPSDAVGCFGIRSRFDLHQGFRSRPNGQIS